MTNTPHQSVGYWPANAVDDINTARNILCDRGFVNYDFVFVAGSKVMQSLKGVVANSGRSFLEYLIDNKIISKICEVSNFKDHEAILYATENEWPLLKKVECVELINSDSFVGILGIYSYHHPLQGSAKK